MDSEQRFDDETKLLNAMNKLIGDVDLSTLTDEQKELVRSLFSNSQKDRDPEALQSRNFKIRGIFYGSKKSPFDLFRNYFIALAVLVITAIGISNTLIILCLNAHPSLES